jgi:hypothetical protein
MSALLVNAMLYLLREEKISKIDKLLKEVCLSLKKNPTLIKDWPNLEMDALQRWQAEIPEIIKACNTFIHGGTGLIETPEISNEEATLVDRLSQETITRSTVILDYEEYMGFYSRVAENWAGLTIHRYFVLLRAAFGKKLDYRDLLSSAEKTAHSFNNFLPDLREFEGGVEVCDRRRLRGIILEPPGIIAEPPEDRNRFEKVDPEGSSSSNFGYSRP